MRPVFQHGMGFFNLNEQRLLLLTIVAVLLELLAQFALALAVLTKLAGKLLKLLLHFGKAQIGCQRFRAHGQMMLQRFLYLCGEGLALLVLRL